MKLVDKIDKEWELMNRKIVALVQKYMDRSLFRLALVYTNAYELCSNLESIIQKKIFINRAYLVRQLVKLE